MTNAYYLNQFISTTLSTAGGIDDSQTTGIKIASTSGVTTDKPGILCLSYSDPIDITKAEWISYTSIDVSNELQGVTRGEDGFSAKAHSNGVTVAFPISRSHINNLNDALIIDDTETNLLEGILDEDDMASNSATKGVTQQSAKAYVDNGTWLKDSMSRQAIINGNFDVSQRATTFVAGANNDDVYTLDHWNLISDGNDVFDVSQEAITDLPGSNYAIKLDVETAKRGGIVQFLEAKDAQKFKGKTVSISFAVKSANISALRATVLSWASTADAVTSDVVASWGATPTWATNWADNATPADLTVTSSWTTVKVEGIVLDEATVNNLALVIWTPNEETIGDIVYITQVQMNEGSKALPFMPKSYEEELRACQRYCFVPETSATATLIGHGYCTATVAAHIIMPLHVSMRAVPTLETVTAGDWVVDDGITATDVTVLTLSVTATKDLVRFQVGVASGLTQFRPVSMLADGTANRILVLSAEL